MADRAVDTAEREIRAGLARGDSADAIADEVIHALRARAHSGHRPGDGCPAHDEGVGCCLDDFDG